MKIINSALFLVFLAIGINAQIPTGSSAAPELVVVAQSWRFQIRNPAMDENPLLAIEERVQEEQDIRDTAAENKRRAKIGIKPIPPPVRPDPERKDGLASGAYVYEVKIKNTGEKPVRALTLEYVFFDAATKKEVGRRQFASDEEIAPGKSRNLIFRSVSPPTGSINANHPGNESREAYSEQVIIQSVEYKDGSNWKAAVKKQ